MTNADDWKGEHLIPVPRKHREPERTHETRVFCKHSGCRVLLSRWAKTGLCKAHWGQMMSDLRHARRGKHG